MLLLGVAGCRLDVVAEVELDADGSGTVAVVFHLAEQLLDELDAIGVDPTSELSAAVVDELAWQLERAAGPDGTGLVITLRHDVDDPREIGATLRELSAGLAADDPALLLDVEVAIADDGRSTVTGSGGFRPPATAGATLDGEPLGPAGDELAAMVEATVAPALVVTLPGDVVSADADVTDGRTLTWHLPVAAERELRAEADPAPWWAGYEWWLVGAAAALVLVLLVLVLVVATRRRRRRRARQAASFV